MESLEYISKGGKETIMLWYWIPPFSSLLSALLLSVSLMLDPHLLFWPQVMDMLGPSLWDLWNTSGQA